MCERVEIDTLRQLRDALALPELRDAGRVPLTLECGGARFRIVGIGGDIRGGRVVSCALTLERVAPPRAEMVQ